MSTQESTRMKSTLSILSLLVVLASAAPPAPAAVDLREAAAEIDALVAEAGGGSNPEAGDGTFVRRAYLDIAGRVPTADETRIFLDDTAPDKRGALVRELLASPGHVSHSYNFWADIFRIRSRLPGNNGNSGLYYAAWLKGALAENMPYDELVRSLVTAQGLVAENGAVGFYLRDRGMPLDHLSTTVQVFLGTQMACAQCHDHPFDEWTQMDFYKLAAFSQQMTTPRIPGNLDEKFRKEARSMDRRSRQDALRSMRLLVRPYQNAVIEESARPLRLPHDYGYDDAKPEDVVNPQTPFGELVELDDDASKSRAYADWMTSPTNPRFTKVIANRLWKRVFGVGIVEPVDAFDKEHRASHPELLGSLANLMVSLDYDMRAYYQVLYATDLYGRTASSHDPSASEPYAFPGPALRRMTAEQVWDSLLALQLEVPDASLGHRDKALEAQGAELAGAYGRLMDQDFGELSKNASALGRVAAESRRETERLRGEVDRVLAMEEAGTAGARREASRVVDELIETMDGLTSAYAELAFLGEAGSAVQNLNGPLVNGPRQLMRRLANTFPALRSQVNNRTRRYAMTSMAAMDERPAGPQAVRETLRKIRREQGDEAARAYADEMRAKAGQMGQRARGRRAGLLARASELPSPAPENHFLREFGQSDRELIENADPGASVPQALALMNGETFRLLARGDSALGQRLAAADNPSEQIDTLYLAMLSRPPTADERRILEDEFSSDPDNALNSAIWALLNSHQFLFVE
ncbi:hypothetical protein BH23VER1_BH23VER1_04910 [soil metagenome]